MILQYALYTLDHLLFITKHLKMLLEARISISRYFQTVIVFFEFCLLFLPTPPVNLSRCTFHYWRFSNFNTSFSVRFDFYKKHIQGVSEIGALILTGNRTRQKEQLFYLPFCRKTMFN
jgi:hypothetical protein